MTSISFSTERAHTFQYMQLELMRTRPLRSAEWAAIDAAKQDPYNPEFRARMPMIVAEFRAQAQAEMYQWAEKQSKTRSCALILGFPLGGYLGETTAAFRRDMRKIHGAIWGGSIVSQECELGLYRKERTPRLHEDNSNDSEAEITYISRIGALPFEVIGGQAQLHASPQEQRMLAEAYLRRGNELDALRDHHLLQKVPLGEVAMLLSTPQHINLGTRHCSSPVPEGGTVSGFFRAVGQIRPGLGG